MTSRSRQRIATGRTNGSTPRNTGRSTTRSVANSGPPLIASPIANTERSYFGANKDTSDGTARSVLAVSARSYLGESRQSRASNQSPNATDRSSKSTGRHNGLDRNTQSASRIFSKPRIDPVMDRGDIKRRSASLVSSAKDSAESAVPEYTEKDKQIAVAAVLDHFQAKSKSMRKVFREFDLDHNGMIDANEFQIGMEKLGYPPKSKEYKIILQEIRAHDIDGDKDNINYKEFTNSLERSFDISCDNRTKGRVYGQAFRDSIGMSMQVKESAFALSLGQVINRGDDAKYQRDYGKTSQPGDRPDKEKAMFKSHSGILGQSADPKYFSIMRASSTGVTGALEGLSSSRSTGQLSDGRSRSRTDLLQRRKDADRDTNLKQMLEEQTNSHKVYNPARTYQFTKSGDLRFPSIGVDITKLNDTFGKQRAKNDFFQIPMPLY